jgi:threonyl-tRNA synthetase
MKYITLHSDYIKFKPLKKALKSVELKKDEEKEKHIKEPLVVLTAVEKGDSKDLVEKFVESIKEIASQIKAENIVLYPYAHLSSNLSKPEIAMEILDEAQKKLKKIFKQVEKAPFGYYKEFELKVKGHPLSELSREIKSEKEDREEEVNREKLLKKISKIKMSSGKKPPKGLKSNVELGRDLDLYIVSEVVGGGLPLFTPKGSTVKREIERFAIDEELKRGYLHTSTPIMAKSDLYKISGHWQHYKKDMFVLDVRGEKFALRPMTCPFHFVLYKRKPRSYKELPLKYAEMSQLFRNEQSGELRGLIRVRQFTLADAHVICRPDQLEKEFEDVLEFLKFVMEKLKIDDIWYRFSKWDSKNKEKYIDDPKAWESSQKTMKKILDKLKLKYGEADGEAAFYGPKLDLQYKDVYGKEDTLLTIQIDFALPEKFDMTYKDEKGKDKRPMIIHRSSTGATERVMAYILEKTQGALPTWLSPVQVRIINYTDRNIEYCEKVIEKLKKEIPNLRIDKDFDSVPLGGKVRDAEMQRIPYIIVVGDKEEKNEELAIRKRGSKKIEQEKIENFIKNLSEEIKEKK